LRQDLGAFNHDILIALQGQGFLQSRIGLVVTCQRALYAAEPLHDVRVAIKKLRYALEIVDETSGRSASANTRTLKTQQDVLGLAVEVQLQDRRVERLLVQVLEQLLVVENDHRRVLVPAVDDARDAARAAPTAARETSSPPGAGLRRGRRA